jgi:hypothetical protein
MVKAYLLDKFKTKNNGNTSMNVNRSGVLDRLV